MIRVWLICFVLAGLICLVVSVAVSKPCPKCRTQGLSGRLNCYFAACETKTRKGPD